MTKPILCVGALTLDTIFRLDALPVEPGKILPREAVEVAEGMAAAQAASIVRLGGAAALWASAGEDANGNTLVAQISAEGVDTALVRRVAGARSGFSTVLMDGTGRTIIVPQYDAALASMPADVPDFSRFAAVMCDVRWPAAADIALRAARDIGIPGILDLDTGPQEIMDRLAPLASHVVASDAAAQRFPGNAFAVVTAGERGCTWREGDVVRHTPAMEVKAIDTLAAGDVFHAGFAVGLTAGWQMSGIIRFASLAAAIKCTRFGGRLGCPTIGEVLSYRSA